MIYIATPSSGTIIKVPRTFDAPTAGPVRFVLRSTVGLQEEGFEAQILSATSLNYQIQADLDALTTSGEYEYRLEADGLLLASGVLAVGDLPGVERVQFDKTIEYEQYRRIQSIPRGR